MQSKRSGSEVLWFGALLACVLTACGGDDDQSSGGAVAQGGAPAAPMKLADHTAGKACSSVKDCSGGLCTQSFPGNALLGQAATDAPGGYCSFQCTLNADCGVGGICIGAMQSQAGGFFGLGNTNNTNNTNNGGKGMCMERCVASSQCRDGYRCVDTNNAVLQGDPDQPIPDTSTGSCQVAPPTDKLTGDTVGAMCSSDGDCSGGRCVMSDMITRSYPGGYCTGRCLEDADCGDNGQCTPGLAGATGSCYRKCTSDADCGRDGYRCRANVTGSNLCQPGVKPLPSQTSGKACSADSDCGGNAMSCATSSGAGRNAAPYPGGYCTQACVDSSDCGSGGACTGTFAAFGMGTCYKSCTAASECREGYTCRVLSVGGPTVMGGMGGMTTAQPTVCALPPAMRTDQDAGM
jgi:hypothetical protein